MNDVLGRIIEGYETQLAHYGEILALARGAGEGTAEARGVDDTLARLREKARLLERIALIEAGIAPLKERWERERPSRTHEEIVALNAVLSRVAAVLEETLALEGSAARRFAVAQGLPAERGPLVPASHAARYADHDAGEARVSVSG
jgi:hypothetical protein